MKYVFTRFLQEGGAMPEGAPVPEEGAEQVQPGAEGLSEPQGAEQQLQQIAQQLVETLMQQIGDPQAIMAILQMAAEMVGQAAQSAAPAYQRRGGKLVRVQ